MGCCSRSATVACLFRAAPHVIGQPRGGAEQAELWLRVTRLGPAKAAEFRAATVAIVAITLHYTRSLSRGWWTEGMYCTCSCTGLLVLAKNDGLGERWVGRRLRMWGRVPVNAGFVPGRRPLEQLEPVSRWPDAEDHVETSLAMRASKQSRLSTSVVVFLSHRPRLSSLRRRTLVLDITRPT